MLNSRHQTEIYLHKNLNVLYQSNHPGSMTESKKNFTFNKSQSLLSETQTEMEQLWVTG